MPLFAAMLNAVYKEFVDDIFVKLVDLPEFLRLYFDTR
jgi:hypothetical protein